MPPSPKGVKVEIAVLGETQVSRRLMRWSERALNAKPAFVAVSEYLVEVEQELFASEGSSSGHPWTPLKASTLAIKERLGLRPEILRATDALHDALTKMGDKNQKLLIKKDTMIFGVKGDPKEYGSILMKKKSYSGKPRKPVDLNEANRRVIVKIIQNWVARGSVVRSK